MQTPDIISPPQMLISQGPKVPFVVQWLTAQEAPVTLKSGMNLSNFPNKNVFPKHNSIFKIPLYVKYFTDIISF